MVYRSRGFLVQVLAGTRNICSVIKFLETGWVGGWSGCIRKLEGGTWISRGCIRKLEGVPGCQGRGVRVALGSRLGLELTQEGISLKNHTKALGGRGVSIVPLPSTFDIIHPIDLTFGTYNKFSLYFQLIETTWCLIFKFSDFFFHIRIEH